jgi:hypothetical protein
MQSSGKVMSANALYNGMVGLSAPIRGGLFWDKIQGEPKVGIQ